LSLHSSLDPMRMKTERCLKRRKHGHGLDLLLPKVSLGADAVLVEWLLTMGLEANGSQGVRQMIDTVIGELRRIMSVTGCRNLSGIEDKARVKRNFVSTG